MRFLNYLFIILPFCALAQNDKMNYVKTTYYKVPTVNSISSPKPDQVDIEINYVDGFNRPIQKVLSNKSSEGFDLITNLEYDERDNVTKKFLPYVKKSDTVYDNKYVANLKKFPLYQGQTAFYENIYDQSTSSRLVKSAKPGTDWDLPTNDSDADHTVRREFFVSSKSDSVKIYKVNSIWNDTIATYNYQLKEIGSKYYENELFKTVVKNENWNIKDGNNNTKHIFKDINGNIILERSFNKNIKLDTYYIYDQYYNLAYVVPPAVSDFKKQIQEMCFIYKYDQKGRLIEKKVPNKQTVYMIYDKLDRLVAYGPNYSPFNDLITKRGWIVNKYDVFNRILYKGWKSEELKFDSSLRKNFQLIYNKNLVLNESLSASKNKIDVLNTIYTNNVEPKDLKLLKVNFYDNYLFDLSIKLSEPIENQDCLSTPTGLSTGYWSRSLKDSNNESGELKSLIYDKKGRLININNFFASGGYTKSYTKYNYSGQIVSSFKKHKRDSFSTEITLRDNFNYNLQGYLDLHTHQVNNNSVELLEKYEYNEIGRLIAKKIGGGDISASSYYQKIDLKYNIRGWLTDINDINNLENIGEPKDLFALKLNYNTVENEINYNGTPLYNGNISESFWKSASDNVIRKYGYKYDDLQRLESAIYQKKEINKPIVRNSYDENLTYDKNGNILSLKRNGGTDNEDKASLLDNLEYTYDKNNPNRLKSITNTSNSASYIDANKSDSDFDYDENGNLIYDKDKNIQIYYNHLNLPIKIQFANGEILYSYNADGDLLNKRVIKYPTSIRSNVVSYEYLDGFVYKNTKIQYHNTSQGYINLSDLNKIAYVYQFKDNLGNVRISYLKNKITGNLDIVEESNYYPFGLKHKGYNNIILSSSNSEAQKIKFQEQERQEDFGLNLDTFKWRNYDYTIGRFVSVDPLSDKFTKWSPYAFCGNQINSREIEGMEPNIDFDDDKWPSFQGDGVDLDKDRDGVLDNINITVEVIREIGDEVDEGLLNANTEDNLPDDLNDTVEDSGDTRSSVSVSEGLKTISEMFGVTSDAIQYTGIAVVAIGIVSLQPEVVFAGFELYESASLLGTVSTATGIGSNLSLATELSDRAKAGDQKAKEGIKQAYADVVGDIAKEVINNKVGSKLEKSGGDFDDATGELINKSATIIWDQVGDKVIMDGCINDLKK